MASRWRCARVLRYTDGVFVNSGPMETGLAVHCGPTVVLAVGAAQLIVTTHVAPCNDPAFFDLHGIDLARTRLLCVKAKNHFRAASPAGAGASWISMRRGRRCWICARSGGWLARRAPASADSTDLPIF